MTHYSRKLTKPFDEVIQKVTQRLSQQGFGVITSIDIQEVFKKKLDINFRKYKILGACNPEFAYRAISTESHIGLMLPCNVVVQEHENGEVEVSAVAPLETIGKNDASPQLLEVATEVGHRLRKALDDLGQEEPGAGHEDALPEGAPSSSSPIFIQG